MADFNNVVTIDTLSAINSLNRLDQSLGKTTAAMGTFQVVADKNIGGAGFADLAQSADKFGKSGQESLKRVEKSAVSASRSIRGIGLSWRDVGRIIESQIIFSAINRVASGFFEAADAAAEFQLQVARIDAIAENLNFGEVQTIVEDLATALGRPFDEVGSAVFEAFQNDLGDTAKTIEILEGEANSLALVTGGTLTQAVNALSSVYKTFGDDLGTSNTATEQFFGTINAGRITLADLESSLGTLSPLAIQIGVTFKELTDSLATITLTGTKANVATTQLRNVFNKLIKPTQALQKVYEDLGVRGFQELSEESGGFVGALEKLQGAVAGQEDGLSRLFNTIRGNVGVLNILTNQTELYDDTSRRTSESASALNDEIKKIDDTPARVAARNAAELEKLNLIIGEQTLAIKNELVGAFILLTKQSTEVQGAVGAVSSAFLIATIAVAKFGVVAGVAFPPLAAFIGTLAAGVGLVEGLKFLGESVTEVSRESQKLDAARWEAFIKTLEESRADEIKDIVAEIENVNSVLNKVSGSARETGEAIVKAFNLDVSGVRSLEANLLEAFGDARKRVLDQVEDSINGIDDAILDGTQRINSLTQDLSDALFEIRIEGLTEGAQATERLRRAGQEVEKAFRLAGQAGLSEESQESARAAAEEAVQKARAAKSAVARTGSALQLRDANALIVEAIQNQIQLEERLNRLRQSQSLPALRKQKQELEDSSFTAKELVQAQLDARERLDEAVTSGATQDRIKTLTAEYEDATEAANKALDSAASSEILGTFGLEEQFDRAISKLQEGLSSTKVDWVGVVDQFKTELETRPDLKATVSLTGEIVDTVDRRGGGGLVDAVQGAAGAGGLPADQQSNVIKAVVEEFKTQRKFENTIKDSAVKIEAARSEGFQSLFQALGGPDGLAKPLLGQLKNIDSLSQTQLTALVGNLKKALSLVKSETKTLSLFGDDEGGGIFGSLSSEQAGLLTTGINAIIDAAQTRLETIEAVKLFDPDSLKTAEEILERFSTEEFASLAFEVDSNSLKDVVTTLDNVKKNGDSSKKAVESIGTGAGTAKQGVSALKQTTDTLVGSANRAKGSYQQLLNTAREALRVAQQAANLNRSNGNNLAHGGQPLYRQGGGDSRGQDSIPAMLSPGEFVVNSKSARQFLPTLQAINAGNVPGAGGGTGDTNITIGDVNVTTSSDVPAQSARDIAQSLKREIRRGTSRL